MQLFQKVQMASEDVKSYLGTGVFYKENKEAPIHDGAVVVMGDLVDHDAYAGMKDINTRKLTAPKAATDKVVFVDYVGVSQADVMGVTYRIGEKTAGLSAVAGEKVRYRVPKEGDEFWLGADNFKTPPTVGQFAAPTANETVLTVSSSATQGATCLKIETTKNLITGAVNDGIMYYCRVVSEA